MDYTDQASHRAYFLRAKYDAIIDNGTHAEPVDTNRGKGVIICTPTEAATFFEDGSVFTNSPSVFTSSPFGIKPGNTDQTKLEEVKEYARQYLRLALPVCDEDVNANKIFLNRRAAGEVAKTFTLSEKGKEWEVVKPPTTVWLDWALKSWWEVSQETPPPWAAALRARWDPVWAQSHAWEQHAK